MPSAVAEDSEHRMLESKVKENAEVDRGEMEEEEPASGLIGLMRRSGGSAEAGRVRC